MGALRGKGGSVDRFALKRLLEERRALVDPGSRGFAPATGQGRRSPGLSQGQMDTLLHRAAGTYGRLENGRYLHAPDELLEDVSRILGMTEQEWVALWRYARAQDPPGPLNRLSGKRLPSVWQDVLNGVFHMAFVTDDCWDLIAWNDPFAELVGGHVPANVMEWMLLSPQGRRVLTNWEASWAPLMLPQLRSAVAARPFDGRLEEIEKRVLADREAGPMYEAGGTYVHVDGGERPLHHPVLGPGWVTVCAAEPMAAPGARLTVLVFRAGEARPYPRKPMLSAQ